MKPEPLTVYLAGVVRSKITHKKLFRGEYVFFGDFMAASSFLFETGTALGHRYRDDITTFASLFCQPGQENDAVSHLSKSVAARVTSLGHEPEDFMELYFIPEATRLMRSFQDAGAISSSEWSDFPKLTKLTTSASGIWVSLQCAAAEGIAFGYSQPELAEKLLTHQNDAQSWQDAQQHGLDIPARPPRPKSIQERQTEAVELIRPYISKIRPDLMAVLGI
jgi:hypothetical protein